MINYNKQLDKYTIHSRQITNHSRQLDKSYQTRRQIIIDYQTNLELNYKNKQIILDEQTNYKYKKDIPDYIDNRHLHNRQTCLNAQKTSPGQYW